jgi:RND family efflux transporter MFP subunit
MKSWIKFGVPVLGILVIGYFFSRQMDVTVPVAPATKGTAVNAVTGTVEVLASMDIRIKSQHRGTILENVVKPGIQVEKGDVIARQDSRSLELQVEQVQIRLDAAEARSRLESTNKIDLETLDEELEGVELAVQLKQAPASNLEKLRRERRKKEVFYQLDEIQKTENLGLLRNQLAQLNLQLAQMTTKAPYPGVVAELFAWQGDLVNANQDLLRLVARGRFIVMELTEEDYFGVRDKQPVTLRLASYPDRTFAGTVSRLEDIANSNNKTRNVIVHVEAADDVLVPGLTGEGYLVKDERKDSILIPRRALIGNLVYVVADGAIEVRRVQPGFLGLHQAEILDGIEEGDLVVLEDQNLLKPGERVKAEASN